MQLFYLFCIVAICIHLSPAFAQETPEDDDAAQQQGEQVSITKETIEEIFKIVTPACRTEMETAMETQADSISIECKQQIQGALRIIHGAPEGEETEEPKTAQPQPKRQRTPREKKPKAAKKVKPMDPAFTGTLYVILICALLVGYFKFYKGGARPRDAPIVSKNSKKGSKKGGKKY